VIQMLVVLRDIITEMLMFINCCHDHSTNGFVRDVYGQWVLVSDFSEYCVALTVHIVTYCVHIKGSSFSASFLESSLRRQRVHVRSSYT